jgi:hypothetical protein
MRKCAIFAKQPVSKSVTTKQLENYKPKNNTMALSIGTLEIIWGITKDKPILPEGWKYQEEKDSWLKAISPTGGGYYVSPTKLYPRRQNMRDGTWYCETRPFEGVITLPIES